MHWAGTALYALGREGTVCIGPEGGSELYATGQCTAFLPEADAGTVEKGRCLAVSSFKLCIQ